MTWIDFKDDEFAQAVAKGIQSVDPGQIQTVVYTLAGSGPDQSHAVITAGLGTHGAIEMVRSIALH